MKRLLIINTIALLTIIACQDFVKNEQVIGRYYLISIDTKEDLSLCYRLEDGNFLGVVNETVFAVGYNEDYIIAKQYTLNNNAITNYYIVPVHKENTFAPEIDVIGPLSLEHFNEKIKELNIPNDLTFTREIEELK